MDANLLPAQRRVTRGFVNKQANVEKKMTISRLKLLDRLTV